MVREHFTYKTKGTCATAIDFDLEGHTIHNVVFTRGCNGNLKAIGKLVEGKKNRRNVAIKEGNTCGMKNTSCADQLAHALKRSNQIIKKAEKSAF